MRFSTAMRHLQDDPQYRYFRCVGGILFFYLVSKIMGWQFLQKVQNTMEIKPVTLDMQKVFTNRGTCTTFCIVI